MHNAMINTQGVGLTGLVKKLRITDSNMRIDIMIKLADLARLLIITTVTLKIIGN